MSEEMITRYFKLTYPKSMEENFKNGIRVHAKVQAEEIHVEEAILETTTFVPNVLETALTAATQSEGFAELADVAPPKRKRRTKAELEAEVEKEIAKAFSPMPAKCFPEPFDGGAPTPEEDDW